MAKPNKRVRIRRENVHGFTTISLAMYFFLFEARRKTMTFIKGHLNWKQFDNLFAIYLFEKTGEFATYNRLHDLHNKRFKGLGGITHRSVQVWCKALERKGYIEMVYRYESLTTGGKRIESHIVTTVKGKAVITKFIRVCLEYAHFLPDFSLLEKDIE